VSILQVCHVYVADTLHTNPMALRISGHPSIRHYPQEPLGKRIGTASFQPPAPEPTTCGRSRYSAGWLHTLTCLTALGLPLRMNYKRVHRKTAPPRYTYSNVPRAFKIIQISL